MIYDVYDTAFRFLAAVGPHYCQNLTVQTNTLINTHTQQISAVAT